MNFYNAVKEFEVDFSWAKRRRNDYVQSIIDFYNDIKYQIVAGKKEIISLSPKDTLLVWPLGGWGEKQILPLVNKMIAKYESMLIRAVKLSKKPDFYLKLETIKQIPIDSILGESKNYSGDSRWYLCPLHSEKTPSFVWNTRTNRWHCFGACGKGGDILDLYQALYNVSFREACLELNKLSC